MGVGNVSNVCEVEHVVVVAQLDVRFAAAVGPQQAREDLDVAFAKDAGRSDGCGKHF